MLALVQEAKDWTKLLQRFVLLRLFYNMKLRTLSWAMSKLREQMKCLSKSSLTLHKLILTAKLFGFQNSSVRLQRYWTLYSIHSLHNAEQQYCSFSDSPILKLLILGIGVNGVTHAMLANFWNVIFTKPSLQRRVSSLSEPQLLMHMD